MCACRCLCVCVRERHQGKRRLTGHVFFFFFFFLFHRRPKKPRFPQDALPNRTPQQASSHHSQQIYKTHRFTLQCDHWEPLTTENCMLLSARRPTQPQAWCCPTSHHKFLKMITPFTFLLYFLPRLFTTPIFHIICSRQHQLLIFISAQILSLLNLLPPCSCPLSL